MQTINNGWVTMKDKEGEPYHVKLDEETDKKTDKPENKTEEGEKEKYKLKEGSKITQKRFDNLFDDGSFLENHQFRKTIVLDNKHQVEFDKKRGFVTFYEQGDLSEREGYNAPKGTVGMLQKFRTDDYNKLVDYLFDNNQEWRFGRNAKQLKLFNAIMEVLNSMNTKEKANKNDKKDNQVVWLENYGLGYPSAEEFDKWYNEQEKDK